MAGREKMSGNGKERKMPGNDDKKGKVGDDDKRKKVAKGRKRNKSDNRNLTLRRTINFTGGEHFNLGDCRQRLCPDLRRSAIVLRLGLQLYRLNFRLCRSRSQVPL